MTSQNGWAWAALAATLVAVPVRAGFVTIDVPGATGTHVQGISGNNIVGYYQNATGQHGFLYNGSTYTTLDDPNASPGETFAYGVSGSTVVGYYFDGTGVHGFVFTPDVVAAPAPASLTLLGLGCAGLALRALRKRR
jgi:hypothetical protein